MSLLTNYEGLRHQIERLVRENEELKKLVRLIRENQELKSAIRMQAGALGISGFSSGVGEAPPGAPQRQGAFLPQAPAAANDPAAEEVGVSGLPSTADILNSPQLSPTAVSMLLPSLGPMTQSSALTNLLGSPLGNHLTSPLAVSVPSLIASALGLPSTGSLSPHSGSMMVPPGGTPTSSLGLPTGSLTPHGGSMMVPLGGTPTGSLDLPTTGSLASSSPLVGPQFTSTTAPPGVSQSLLANPMTNEAPRVRLAEPLQGSTSGPHPSPGTTGPAATGKINGPRCSETSRKSNLELERKLAHRKISKFPETPREPKQLALERLVGEIAFQLDRRILSSIFPERVRLYGFTVSNIPEKIIQASLNPNDHKLDEELCQTLTQRYVSIMNRLQSLGYNGRVHPALTEQLVNAYGILRERPELAVSEGGSYTVDFLQRVLVETVHPSMLTDALLLLSCLSQLAHDDGKPMFIW
uniref:Spermatogenesis and centriole associated 1 n=1 Tax=Pipistrellus kuhlii TaxID=59472 RepID=A0A7J7RLE0_PIPKU|nr:spermatogenesis and centriole associated 1 [Pipistrellus kuhlii]